MSPREYVARDPRTGQRIGKRGRRKKSSTGVGALMPDPGPWQSVPIEGIVPLAKSEVEKIEVRTDSGKWTLGRIDAIKGLHRVLDRDAEEAYEALVEALEDDFPDVRIAGLKSLPSFALRRQGILIQCLSDRILDEVSAVSEEAMECLKKVAPVFPSGCVEILRRELRSEEAKRRGSAFEALRLAAKEWPEVGCLHLDELIREDELDLRVRGSKILRTIAAKGGAEAWDLIGWSLRDEDSRVRRSAAQTLPILAEVEPRIAAILVEGSMGENDRGARKYIITALKKLDMQSHRVTSMIMKGAVDEDIEMRRACISQLTIIMSGQELREAAGELLKTETDESLKKRLNALAMDPDFEGTEQEKNRKLAPLDSQQEEEKGALQENPPLREYDKRQSGRPASEDRQ